MTTEKAFYSITWWLEHSLTQIRKTVEQISNPLISLDLTNHWCTVMIEQRGTEYTLTGATVLARVELQSQWLSL